MRVLDPGGMLFIADLRRSVDIDATFGIDGHLQHATGPQQIVKLDALRCQVCLDGVPQRGDVHFFPPDQ